MNQELVVTKRSSLARRLHKTELQQLLRIALEIRQMHIQTHLLQMRQRHTGNITICLVIILLVIQTIFIKK